MADTFFEVNADQNISNGSYLLFVLDCERESEAPDAPCAEQELLLYNEGEAQPACR